MGEGGLRENPCSLPRKINIAAKIAKNFKMPENFGLPRSSKAPFRCVEVQTSGKQDCFRDTRT